MDKENNKISLGIIITALPFLGYFYAYIYEYGYILSFNIPHYLISIRIEEILFNSFLLLILGVVLFGLIDSLYTFFAPMVKKSYTHRFIIIWGMFWLFTIVILPLVFKALVLSWGFVPLLLLFLFYYVLPISRSIFRKNKERSFSEHFENIANNPFPSDNLVSKSIDKDKYLALSLYALVLLAFFMYEKGKLDGKNKTEYYTVNCDSTMVLIKIYSDNYIFGKPAEIRKNDVNTITILKSSSFQKIELRKYYIQK